MNRKSLSLLFSAALLSGAAMADTVSPEQALGKANRFFQQSVNTRGQAQSLTLAHTAQADGETHFYVFNNPAGGYVIVGGDDVAHDVLAYSESGSFDYDQLSPATRWWLGKYQSQIHSAIEAERQGIPAQSEATRALGIGSKEIKPLLGGIEWDQMAPFNAYIQGSGQIQDEQLQYCAGCVATATAQVMRYWKYPERGMFSHAYRYKDLQLETNFAEHVYHWDLMQEKYERTYSGTPEENAVALLLRDVGIALSMQYGQLYANGSGVIDEAVPYALRTFFGYSKDMQILQRDSIEGMTNAKWEQIVYNELEAGRPVIFGGTDPNGGGAHSFVCDGYKNGYFHINWGWDGKGNQDYYLLTATQTKPALAPNVDGAGGNGQGRYGANQSIVIGIQPDPQSEGFVYLTEPLSVPAEVPHGPQHYEGKLYNPTSQDVKLAILLHMMDNQHIYVDEQHLYSANMMLVLPAKQEAMFAFDVPGEALVPGITYSAIFEIVDMSNPDISLEEYQKQTPWLLSEEITHIEGPEHELLDFSLGITVMCAPFDTQIPEDVEAYTADRISGDQVIMKQAQSIEAGRSYVLTSKPMEQPVLLTGMKTAGEGWSNEPVFKGNLSSKTLYQENACYVMVALETGEPVLLRTDQHKGISAHNVIIDGTLSDAEILYLNFDEATGIQQVDDCSNGSGLSYNLMGQPQHEAKGLVVEDGRVTFVK